MPEPTTTAVASIAAAISGVTMALLGVDYHSLLYGLVGSLIAIGQSEHTSRWKAVVGVVLSTITGSVLGTAAVELFNLTGKTSLLLGCIVGGAGAQALVLGLVNIASSQIERIGGKKS